MIKKKNLSEYLLYILFLFLPISSWLVSLTGVVWISLLRDLLIILILIISLLNIKRRELPVYVLTVITFIVWGLLTFFWKEASTVQWLKGFRLLFMPLVLFLSLQWLDLNMKVKNNLVKIVFGVSVVIIVIALLELVGIKIPLSTSLSGYGSLENNHLVGNLSIGRLSSILAGPNALGLYLLVIVAFSLLFKPGLLGKNALMLYTLICAFVLLLTFSRSAFIGLVIMLFAYLGNCYTVEKKPKLIITAISILISLLVIGLAVVYKYPKAKDLLTHDNSSSLRFVQYERIWNQRFDIGLFGRGAGTAGPSSQYRLDGGENHWTENVYLDVFEELGLVGLALYIAIMLYLIYLNFLDKEKRIESRVAFLISIAFLAVGIFLNYYTGQVAIYLFWLINGLALKEQYGKNFN